jgi:hypothetical protein
MTERDIIERFERDVQEISLFQKDIALQIQLKDLCVAALFNENIDTLQSSREVIITNFADPVRAMFLERMNTHKTNFSVQENARHALDYCQAREQAMYIKSIETFYGHLSSGQPTDKNCALAYRNAMVPLKI